jgi:CDP-glucose 4,6-dehydratase
VLDCLAGYLLLGKHLYAGEREFASGWNLGSAPEDNRSVGEVLMMLQSAWPELQWRFPTNTGPHEAGFLFLDSSKARAALKWEPVWDLQHALRRTAEWYRRFAASSDAITNEQIDSFVMEAASAGCSWVSR